MPEAGGWQSMRFGGSRWESEIVECGIYTRLFQSLVLLLRAELTYIFLNHIPASLTFIAGADLGDVIGNDLRYESGDQNREASLATSGQRPVHQSLHKSLDYCQRKEAVFPYREAVAFSI